MTKIARWMMAAAAAIAPIGAFADESVDYYDPVGGTNATCSVCSVYTGERVLSNGWYVVAGVITNSSRIRVNGDVNLILCDNSELAAIEGVTVDSGNNYTNCLTIWAQSTNTFAGKLTSTDGADFAGIGGRAKGAVGIVTINGGVVTAIGGYHGGAGIGGGIKNTSDGDLFISGMKVGYVNGSGEVEKWEAADSRMDACRNRDGKTVRLEICDSHVYENGSCRYCGAAEPIGISGVMAKLTKPGGSEVKLHFTVSGNPALFGSGWRSPCLSVTATDTATGETRVAAPKALSGDTDAYPGEHTVVWDMSTVLPEGFSSTGMVFTVAYLKMPDYCVFDLSGIPTEPIDLSDGIDDLTVQELRIAKAQVASDIMTEECIVSNLTAQITELDAQLTTAQETHNNGGYTNASLSQLEQDVKDLMAQEAAVRQLVVDDPGQTYLGNNNYYQDYARPLALAMIKYYLVYAGEVPEAGPTNVEIGAWFGSDYTNKHFCVRYIKSPGVLAERYFDYVTCDNDGNPLIKVNESDTFDDVATNVAGIVVLEKVPTYAFYDGDDNTKIVAVEDTSENRATYKAQLGNSLMKGVNVCGKHYYVSQRIGWTTAAEGDSIKGAVRIGLNAGKEAVKLTKAIEDMTASKTDLSNRKSEAETKLSGLYTPLSAITNRLVGTEGSSAVPDIVRSVSFLDAPPEDGWADLYKTSNLVMRLVGPEKSGAQPFYCAVFETTQRQWELVTGKRPSYFANETCYATRPVERISYNMLRGTATGAQWPETNSVDDVSFLGVFRTLTGLAFDLPTEAQWEFACRAGTATDYSYGDAPNGAYMWYKDNSGGETEPVGTRRANNWGLYDMHGNVSEWCLDWYVDDPADPGYPGGRVVRGGSWFDYAGCCTSSFRIGDSPECDESHYGLRLVLPMDRDAPAFGRAECAGASASIRVGVTASVSNVVARQRWPWNGLVDIDYDVSGYTDGLKAEIVFMERDGEERSWPATKFLAGFEPSAEPGHHRATWNATAEDATNIEAKVKAIVRLVEEQEE